MSADALPRIAGASPAERLLSLREAVAGRIVFTTSFGIEDQAITHVIAGMGLDVALVTLDTGRLFPSTYALWKETEARYGIRIEGFTPRPAAVDAYVARAGLNGFYESREARLACCDIRKVEPLRRALAGAEAWVTGLRADQSSVREAVTLASWDADHRLIKTAPLFDWSRERVAEFVAAEAIPVNSLHARGYPSIGCEPCTRAIRPGEPERAGRWWWENDSQRECGLHVDANGRLVRAA